jgi:hypothetical protein
MAYNAVPTVATGDTWSAANHNTYIRDNFAAGVPDIFTAAGDIAYATAANAATPLAIGSSDQSLTVISGLPAWSYGPGIVLLESLTISTSDDYDVVFDNIDQSFSHLEVIANYRQLGSASNTPFYIELNGDTSSSNYNEDDVRIKGDDTVDVTVHNGSQSWFGQQSIYNASGDLVPNHVEFFVYNYSNSLFGKNVRTNTSNYLSTGNYINLYGRYLDTTAINQIKLYISQTYYPGYYFGIGSSFQLYGIR